MKDRTMFDILQPVVIGLSSLILIGLFIAIVTIITDPGSVGRFFGEIVAGFNSTIK
jgi:hypothetical protein